MRWRKKTLERVGGHLHQLGLKRCPICQGGTMTASVRPGDLRIGGDWFGSRDPRNDPDAESIYLVVVRCGLCGYLMLFDSSAFVPGDEPTFVVGMTEQEEDEWEAAQG